MDTKGRPGFMVGVDEKLKHKEESADRKRTYEEMKRQFVISKTHLSTSMVMITVKVLLPSISK